MSESKHTPTPWHVSPPSPNEGEFAIYGPDGEMPIADLENHPTGLANAAFIVRAVNAHEELVEALKAFMERHKDDEDAWSLPLECWQMARAALAKAEPSHG